MAEDQLRKSEFRSTSGFPTDSYYTSDDVDSVPPPPGEYPFTRGFSEEGFRRRFWDMEMYAGFGSPEEANQRYRFLLENGATGGVSIALDLPTQLGYDSDDEMSRGEVGRTGVALDTYSDIEALMHGVDLKTAGHVFSTANCIGPVMYAWVLLYCERNDVDPDSFRLQIQNDPIKEYYARGTHFLPIEPAIRLATDVIVHSVQHTPRWLPISVSGSHMKQAGGSPAQEAAFTLANTIEYMKDVERKGVPLERFNPNLELHFCTDMDFFEEVAKYRAVRRAWSEIATQRFGVKDVDALAFRLHAATSGLPLTAQQPMNNIARITLQALAQILGGCEATRTASWDEALGIPTEDAARMSLRINQVIAHETGVADTSDPLGGSYYVEKLTNAIYDVIMSEIAKIDDLGGAVGAVSSGYYAETLAAGAYQQQQELESGERKVVGVNVFSHGDSVKYPRFKTNEGSEAQQISRLIQSRAARDDQRVKAALSDVRDASNGADNVVPAVKDAVAANATIGEIAGVWREVYGDYASEWVAL